MSKRLARPKKQAIYGSLQQSIDLLGKSKVLVAGEVAPHWHYGTPGKIPIRYTEETFRRCADLNKQGSSDWRLVYVTGRSLREQRQIVGVDTNHQPCFFNNDWWLKDQENDWATRNSESGYHLLDFKGRFGRTSWQRQEEEIVKLAEEWNLPVKRADEHIISEAAISNYQINKERLLRTWYHWGYSLGFGRVRVFVGCFYQFGWCVDRSHPGFVGGDCLRVCLSLEFQN